MADKDNRRSYLCLVKFLLSPIALLYALIVVLRNLCFDFGLLKSTSFDFPVIAVGNLRVGGTGKTPMVSYLLMMLQKRFNVAILSRGYGRKTKGFLMAIENSTAEQIGDEPKLIRSLFQDVTVAVDEKRVRGIERLRSIESDNGPEIILLDDAMQHRSVNPGFLLLLTAYNKLFVNDYILPIGRLREPKSSAKRAHAIVVTKCPPALSNAERQQIEKRIALHSNVPIFFAFEDYKGIRPLNTTAGEITLHDLKHYSAVLISGLADPSNLERWAKRNAQEIEHIAFKDHHWFSDDDLDMIVSVFVKMKAEKKLLLTTEKDAVRLNKLFQNKKFADLPMYAIQHEMSFFEEDQVPFEKKINDFISSYSADK